MAAGAPRCMCQMPLQHMTMMKELLTVRNPLHSSQLGLELRLTLASTKEVPDGGLEGAGGWQSKMPQSTTEMEWEAYGSRLWVVGFSQSEIAKLLVQSEAE